MRTACDITCARKRKTIEFFEIFQIKSLKESGYYDRFRKSILEMVDEGPDEILELVLAAFAIEVYRSISFFLFLNDDDGGSGGKRLTQFSSSR